MGGLFERIRSQGKDVKPQQLYQGTKVKLNPKIFGPGFEAVSIPVSFVFAQGGVGDYINWCSVIQWIRDTYPHVDGRIFVSELFLQVAEYLFKDTPRWKVLHRDRFPRDYESGSPICYPKPGTQLINACGAHLMDVGAWYFSCIDPLDAEYRFLPTINYEGPWKWPELDPESNFALFTPGSTSEVREMPVKAFNELVQYTISKGVTPVFIGKRELSEQYEAKFSHYNLNVGIDLRERTNLIEVTQIMRKARFIIGLDNGLLHMAGTTDVPTIFGHNVAHVHHRELRRREGMTIDITLPESELGCIGCQSKIRFISKHDFRECIFKKYDPPKDRKCLELLFKNDSQKWKNAIDQILHTKRGRVK